MPLLESSVLFFDDRSSRDPNPIHGGPWLSVRDGGAYEWTGQAMELAKTHQLRSDPLTWSAAGQRGAPIEPAAVQELLDPMAVDLDLASWAHDNLASPVDVASAFPGRIAYRYTGDGTQADSRVKQTAGTFTGSLEATSILVESQDAVATQLGMRNETDSVWARLASFNMTTGEVTNTTGSGHAGPFLLRNPGPNGGKLWWFSIFGSATVGKSRGTHWYPRSSTVATTKSIVHYLGHIEDPFARLPFETTLAGHALSAAPIPAGEPHSGCLIYIAGERSGVNTGVHRVVLHCGDGHTTDARFSIYQVNNDHSIVVLYDDGTTERFVQISVTIAEGDLVVVTWSLAPNGVLRAQARVGAGALVAPAATGTGGIATSWGGTTPRLRIGHASSALANPCRMWLCRLAIVKTADLLEPTDSTRIYQQCRRYKLGADKKLLAA